MVRDELEGQDGEDAAEAVDNGRNLDRADALERGRVALHAQPATLPAFSVRIVISFRHASYAHAHLGADDDRAALARHDLLERVHRFLHVPAAAPSRRVMTGMQDWAAPAARTLYLVEAVARHEQHHRHGLVDEGERAVLELAGQDALAVQVRNLFDFLCLGPEPRHGT